MRNIMNMNSLTSRITLSITAIILISFTITTFSFVHWARQELSRAIEENALNLLEATRKHLESEYNSIRYHKTAMLARRKAELKNNTTIAIEIIHSAYRQYRKGQMTESAAKRHAATDIQQLRHDEGVGYFWINDTTRPYPEMIMHPTFPELNRTVLDDPEFNCALGTNENLFKAAVDVCLEKGEGYIDYLWPKPVAGGLTARQPKISYVKLFKPWNWIIGTGLYIDDIDKDVQDRIDAVIEDLNKTITSRRISDKNGYFLIFNENNRMLVHPNFAGTDIGDSINPATGNKLSDEIKKAAFSPHHSMEYLWDKPGHEGEYRFHKKIYIDYYEPLGWYIASFVDREYVNRKISDLTRSILLSSLVFLFTVLIISFLISRSVTNPLNTLIRSISKTDNDGIPVDAVPETGTAEIKVLGKTINSMVDSVRKSRKELKSQRDFSLNIINNSPDIIYGITPDGITTFINPSGEQVTGYSREEIIGKNWWELFYPGKKRDQVDRLLRAFSSSKGFDHETILTCRNGERKNIVWNDLYRKDDKDMIVEIIGFGHDITERKQSEEQLRHLRNYLANIIDSMPSVLVGVDKNGRVTLWNIPAEKATGIAADAAQGKKLSDVYPQMAPEMKTITESISTREINQELKKPRESEKGTRYEDVTIYPLVANGLEGAVIRIDDVTEKVRMEEMMIQSEKMLSVGGLAAGMAHEINNPIAGIMQTANVMANRLCERIDMPANLEAAEAAGTTTEAIREFMEARGIPKMINTINESGQRMAETVTNMLSFARKSDAALSSYDMAELLDKTLALAATDFDLKKQYDFKNIEIQREYETALPLVSCEAAKIQQVLLNIFKNGAQAMQEAGTETPRFTVRTRFEKKREMVCIEIADNGPGMDEATRRRVFEPFYTTKPVGIGTGLGLSVSYFIITENHGGEMTVESTPGSGAKFIIRLPVERKPQ